MQRGVIPDTLQPPGVVSSLQRLSAEACRPACLIQISTDFYFVLTWLSCNTNFSSEQVVLGNLCWFYLLLLHTTPVLHRLYSVQNKVFVTNILMQYKEIQAWYDSRDLTKCRHRILCREVQP